MYFDFNLMASLLKKGQVTDGWQNQFLIQAFNVPLTSWINKDLLFIEVATKINKM